MISGSQKQIRTSLFDHEESHRDLRRLTVRGTASTFGAQSLKFVLGIGSTAILARILTPADYGLIAMTGVFTGFISMFKDAGLSMATVQQDRITHDQVSTLFWINLLLCFAISAVMFCAGPGIAAFYKEPRLIGVTWGLAVAFLLGGTTTQHMSLLRRQLRFNSLILIDISSMLLGIVTAVVMAFLGYRYWALVGMAIAMALGGTILTWVILPWIPGRPKRKTGTRRMLRFGSDILIFNIVNYFARQADNLLIGWMWGPVSLAFYEKAYRLLLMPVRQINGPMSSVIVPALSRMKADPQKLARFYLKALELLIGVSVPVVLGFCVFADELVLLWLGPNWVECAHLFRLLTVAAVLGAILNPSGWLMISSGNTRGYKWAGLASSVLIVTAFIIGLPYGARGVAIAYSVATALNFFPAWWFATRGTAVSYGRLLWSFVPVLVAGLIAAAAGHGILQVPIDGLNKLWGFAVAAFAYGGTYMVVLLIGFRRWHVYREVWCELRGRK